MRRRRSAPLRQAVALAPKAGLIRILLGHALLQTGNDALLDEAVSESASPASTASRSPPTATAISPPPTTGRARWRRPSLPPPRASSSMATSTAPRISPQRAQAKFSRGSPGWLKADDIINYHSPTDSKK